MAESQGKIIVIDDEILIIKRLEALLIPRHYEVISASNGEAALKLVLQEQPDLILLDVLMPGMNGFEVCRQLKDDPVTRLIPVVLMTALGEVEDRVKGLEAGADDYLTKPVNRDELLARIQSSLRLKRTIDQKIDSLQSIQNYLSKFVPQSVKRLIQVDPERLEQDKREQDVSVLFVDISGYARLSEILSQEQVNFMVERYFSSFLDSIHANEGDINETAGDGLMVIFADTDPHQHAIKAVQTGLDILARTTQLNQEFQETFAPIALHIGINSGVALVGLTKLEGVSGARWTYTASGSVTNVAARITELGQGGDIFVGPETARRIEGHFALRRLGRRQLKNIQEAVMIYQVMGTVDDQP